MVMAGRRRKPSAGHEHERRHRGLGVPSWRTMVGFFVAPLSPALVIGVFPLLDGRFADFGRAMTLAATIGYPLALLAGVPLFLTMNRLDWTGIGHYVGVGVVAGIAGYLLLFQLSYLVVGQFNLSVNAVSSATKWLFLCVSVVTIAMACFWAIAQPQRRP